MVTDRNTPKLIRDFEDAVRWHEMRGAQMPESWPEIDAEYDRTKAALVAAFKKRAKQCNVGK